MGILFKLFIFLILLSPLCIAEHVFIDVGQGNCTIISFPDGAPLVVDAGSTELRGDDEDEKSAFKHDTIDYIRQGILFFISSMATKGRRYDLNFIVSHAHADHTNLIEPILSDMRMRALRVRFLLGGRGNNYSTKVSRELVKIAQASGQDEPIFVADFADENSIAPFEYLPETLEILAAPNFDTHNMNHQSIVLRVQTGNITSILTGDATGQVTDYIVGKYTHNLNSLRANIYQACHHGSDTDGSNNENFINAIQPKWVVFSSGQKYHHPKSSVVLRVLDHVERDTRGYHILRYYNPPIDDIDDAGRQLRNWSELRDGYVVSTTNLKIFNTQDQRTISFSFNPDLGVDYNVSPGIAIKSRIDDFSPGDIQE